MVNEASVKKPLKDLMKPKPSMEWQLIISANPPKSRKLLGILADLDAQGPESEKSQKDDNPAEGG